MAMDPIQTVTSKELEELLKKNPKLSIIDCREDEEVAQGKIPQATHIRLSEVPHCTEQLTKDTKHFFICRSGGRSNRACEYLQKLGFDVVNVEGGMLDWEGEVE